MQHQAQGHLPGAWWVVRSRLQEARRAIGPAETLILTCRDGRLAGHALDEVKLHWPGARVLLAAGGNRQWADSGRALEFGLPRPTTVDNDIWRRPPPDDEAATRRFMEDYLAWEIGLIEQIRRDPTVRFGPVPPA